MSIPDKAVEAARDRVHHFMRGWDQGEAIEQSSTAEGRAVLTYSDLGVLLEAAEPYLTSRESALRQALEKHLVFMNGSPTVSVESIRRILAAHPEVES